MSTAPGAPWLGSPPISMVSLALLSTLVDKITIRKEPMNERQKKLTKLMADVILNHEAGAQWLKNVDGDFLATMNVIFRKFEDMYDKKQWLQLGVVHGALYEQWLQGECPGKVIVSYIGIQNVLPVMRLQKDGTAIALDPKPSQKIWNHSPDGFQWGYGGSGPAQLALAILFDVTGDKERSVRLHQEFKRDKIATLDDSFVLNINEIQHWLAEHP